AFGRAFAFGTVCLEPVLGAGQGAAAVAGRFEVSQFRQDDRQLFVGQQDRATLRAIDNWDGRAPVPLAADAPVTHPVINHATANALLLHVIHHLFGGLVDVHAVQELGIDHLAVFFLDLFGVSYVGGVAVISD